MSGDGLQPRDYPVESRSLAEAMGCKHLSVMSLVAKYGSELRQFGSLTIETDLPTGPGRPSKHALLNTNQCFLLLSMARNTPKVVDLKARMVQAMGTARRSVGGAFS